MTDTPAYDGDENLGRLLDRAGASLSPADVRDLIEGVLAAPLWPDRARQ